MNKKNVIFHFLFLFLICVWLVTILNVILSNSPTNQIASSSSFFGGYFGLFYWSIAGVAAATSFMLGLDKLGIIEDFRVKIFSEGKGYEPEIYVALPESPPETLNLKSTAEDQLPIEQNSSAAIVAKVNSIIKKEKGSKNANEMKAFYLFGATDFKKCPHEFGFLGKSFEDKPIPDECFGCPKVIECFKKSKKPKKNKKPELSTAL